MRFKTIKWVVVSVVVIFLLTTILTAIVTVREVSRSTLTDPVTSDQNTIPDHDFTGDIKADQLTPDQTEVK